MSEEHQKDQNPERKRDESEQREASLSTVDSIAHDDNIEEENASEPSTKDEGKSFPSPRVNLDLPHGEGDSLSGVDEDVDAPEHSVPPSEDDVPLSEIISQDGDIDGDVKADLPETLETLERTFSASRSSATRLVAIPPSEDVADRPPRQAPFDSAQTVALRRASDTYLKHKLPATGAMTAVLSWFITRIFGVVFRKVDFNEPTRAKIERAQAEGQVVYAFETHSFLDYLYFNWAFIKFDIPLVRFANGINTMILHRIGVWLRHLVRARDRSKPAYQMAAFDHHVRSGDPIWLFLKRAQSGEQRNISLSQPYLLRLMQLQESLGREVFIVPTLLVWEKRPDQNRRSIFDELFGTIQAPGFWRKAFQFLNMSWQSFFIFGAPCVQIAPPIALSTFRAELPEADVVETSELLRERALDELRRERQVIMGPPLPTPRALKEDLVRRPAVEETIQSLVAQGQGDEASLRAQALEQLDEIAADASLLWTKALGAMLSPIFYLIYRGFHIDMKGMERLRNTARKSRVILVPSHKSHIDYLVLSYVFYQHGLMPPHIAAGVNLSFWPMGPIFRRSGAFFLRRTFRGDPLYATVFRQYLVKLLEEGVMIEFFPEGTRSRTGKVLKPRYGMLQMIIRAAIAGRFEHLAFQPISIGYEKIIEAGSYKREALGGEKEQESASALLKATSVLASNYGRVFIEFAEPIDLASYMKGHVFNPHEHTEEDLSRLSVRLAHRIMYDIAESTPITPTAIAAIVLMNAPGFGIGHRQFLTESGFLLQLLISPSTSARLSTPLQAALEHNAPAELVARIRAGDHELRKSNTRSKHDFALGEAIQESLHEAILLLERNRSLSVREVNNELFYASSDSQRRELDYYKNNIIHFLVSQTLLASAILTHDLKTNAPPSSSAPLSLQDVSERALYLSRLFKYEFFYPERAPEDGESTQFESSFFFTLRSTAACGWVDFDPEEETITLPTTGPSTHPSPALEFMRSLLLPYIEGYSFVFKHLALLAPNEDGAPSPSIEEREFPKVILSKAEVAWIQGDLKYPESMSLPLYQNAVRYLVEREVLEIETVQGRRGKTVRHLRLHPDWIAQDRWETLQAQTLPFLQPTTRRASDVL